MKRWQPYECCGGKTESAAIVRFCPTVRSPIPPIDPMLILNSDSSAVVNRVNKLHFVIYSVSFDFYAVLSGYRQ